MRIARLADARFVGLAGTKQQAGSESDVQSHGVSLRVDDLSPIRMQNLAGHVAGIFAREKDVARRDLRRLTGAAERNIRSELRDFLRLKRGWDKRRPDRAGSDPVHANLFLRQ